MMGLLIVEGAKGLQLITVVYLRYSILLSFFVVFGAVVAVALLSSIAVEDLELEQPMLR